ncbi:hypothetical protein D3C83_42810 [compost metagenome]
MLAGRINGHIGGGGDLIRNSPSISEPLEREPVDDEQLRHDVFDRHVGGVTAIEDVGGEVTGGPADLHVVGAQVE